MRRNTVGFSRRRVLGNDLSTRNTKRGSFVITDFSTCFSCSRMSAKINQFQRGNKHLHLGILIMHQGSLRTRMPQNYLLWQRLLPTSKIQTTFLLQHISQKHLNLDISLTKQGTKNITYLSLTGCKIRQQRLILFQNLSAYVTLLFILVKMTYYITIFCYYRATT